MKQLTTLSMMAAIALTGCTSMDTWYTDTKQDAKAQSLSIYGKQQQMQSNEAFGGHQDAQMVSRWASDPHAYMTNYHSNIGGGTQLAISDYVEKMAVKLIKNMRYVTHKTPVAVASFVPVDSNLEETTLVGLHLAENFMHQAQELGLSVIDYKSTGTIRVTEDGDFAFSRDIDELRHWHPIEYVLTGTYTRKENGIEVHARVVGIESRALVASTQGFIPYSVSEQLVPYKKKDGIKLIKG